MPVRRQEIRMLFGRGSRYKAYLEMMEGELKKLENGELASLRSVYSAFASGDMKLIKRAGEAVRRQMSSMTDLQQLGLCERFRTFTSLEWTVDWAGVEDAILYDLKFLSGGAGCR